MVKAIVTDVDGVIVGKKPGVNFPLPSPTVIQKLHELHKTGIPVILNTAKFNFAVKEIITRAGLKNPHITDGGALIIDPLNHQVIKKHVFEKSLAKAIVKVSIEHGFYTEFYGVDEWFIQKKDIGAFTKKRSSILQKEYKAVDSLLEIIDSIDVIKIFAFIHKPEEKPRVEKMLYEFKESIHLVWSLHPLTAPTQNAIITVKGVSKKDATFEVLEHLKIPPHEALAIGDTLGDWNFMNVCKYAGVVGDRSHELIKHAKNKGAGNYFIAPGVDEDGFIKIIDYFLLSKN